MEKNSIKTQGTIYATCGHEITTEWMCDDRSSIEVDDRDREGEKCIACLVVCPLCRSMYENEGLIRKS